MMRTPQAPKTTEVIQVNDDWEESDFDPQHQEAPVFQAQTRKRKAPKQAVGAPTIASTSFAPQAMAPRLKAKLKPSKNKEALPFDGEFEGADVEGEEEISWSAAYGKFQKGMNNFLIFN